MEDTGNFGEETTEGLFGFGGSLEFNEAHKNAGGFAGGNVIHESLASSGADGETEAKRAEQLPPRQSGLG